MKLNISVVLKYLFCCSFIFMLTACLKGHSDNRYTHIPSPQKPEEKPKEEPKAKKVMFVNSYSFEDDDGAKNWAAGIYSGVEEVFADAVGKKEVEIQQFHMDTKRNPGDEFAMQAAADAKAAIDEFQPDVVIACDDAASKFLVKEHLLDTDTEVVFCGVNFDASKYGFPAKNVTGIVEVPPVDLMLERGKVYKPGGESLGYITFDDISEINNTAGIKNVFNLPLEDENVKYVTTMQAWMDAYLELQDKVDFIIMGSANFMKGWNWAVAHQFMLDQADFSKALPITYNSWTLDISLVAYSKRAKEQGTWAANAAMEILGGKSAEQIAIGQNMEGDLFLNSTFAEKFNITFSEGDLADGMAKETPSNTVTPWKVAFVNSYTFEEDDGARNWAMGIFGGVKEALGPLMDNGAIDLQDFHMDTKRNPGLEFEQSSAAMLKMQLDEYGPDLIVACDDAASRSLISQYYVGSETPVVFCGVNFDASGYYDFPVANITGMVEVPPVKIMVDTLKKYRDGSTLAYLTYDDVSEHQNTDGIKMIEGTTLADEHVKYVTTMDEWKMAYNELKTQVDFLVMGSANFMPGWDWADAHQFIIDNTASTDAIPGTYNSWTLDIALLAYAKRSSEQGFWAMAAGLDILRGESPADIPVTQNVEGDLTLNKQLGEALGITFTEEHLNAGELKDTPIN